MDSDSEKVIYRPSLSSQTSSLILLGVYLFLAISLCIDLQKSNTEILWITFISCGILPIAFVIFTIVTSLYCTYLVITPLKIEYHNLFYSITASWNEITRVRKSRYKYWVCEDIVVNKPTIKAFPLIRPLLHLGYMDHKIPIREFDKDWREHPIGKYIVSKIVEEKCEIGENIAPWRI
jgi:hypothetical protein